MGPDEARLSCPGSSVVADSEGEGARFEKNPPAPEIIGLDLLQSFSSQAPIPESEEGEKPIKTYEAQ